MVENVRQAWEDGEHCLGVFIDFRKAFDVVPKERLLAKMNSIGVRGNVCVDTVEDTARF